MKKRKLCRRTCGMLAAIVVASSVSAVPAFAAQDFDENFVGRIEPNQFAWTSYTMGFGTWKYNDMAMNFNREDKTLEFELPFGYVPGTTYRAVSSNPAVATCEIDGHGVQMNGVSNGKVTVTLQKQAGGNWMNLDTIEVTVNGTSILTALDNYQHIYPLGVSPSGLFIQGRNPKATYTYTVDKPGLSVYEYKDANGVPTGINCNATAYGDYVLTVKETLNGVTKEFQKVSMHVKPTTVNENVTVSLSDPNFTLMSNFIYCARNDTAYIFKMKDGTPNNIDHIPDHSTAFDEYVYQYGNTSKCVAISYDGALAGFTNIGNCTVDIYGCKMTTEEVINYDFDKLPDNASYIGTCNITVTE